MPYAGPICLSPCRTRYASFVASWLRLCLLHFHAGFRAGTDIGSVAHPDRSSTERSMRDRCLFYYPPTPIGAIRRLSRANLFGKCCVEGRARSSHISVLSSISVGLSPYIGEQPCAKVKERAGTDLPLRRTAMLFRCRFSFPNSISISKQQCQVNAKVFESGEPYCPAPPSIALCLENWARRDTVF